MRSPLVALSLGLALAAVPNAAALPRAPVDAAVAPEPRAEPLPAPATNLTFMPPLENRAIAGQATHYSPAREGPSPIGSCGGTPMNDNTMGVALSQAGWDRFARHGLTKADLCWKELIITGPGGQNQRAQLMDTCPYDEATQTCGSVCDLDLTTGLFSKLENPAVGIFPIKWTFADGTPSGCGSSKSTASGGSSKGGHQSSGSKPSSSSEHQGATHTPAHSQPNNSGPAAGTPASSDPVMAALSMLFGGLFGGAAPASSTAAATPTPAAKAAKVYSSSSGEKPHVDSIEEMLQAIVGAIIH